MVEVLVVELEYGLHLDVGTDIQLSQMGVRDFDFCNKSNANANCSFRNHFAQLCCLLISLKIVRRSSNHSWQRSLELNDLVLKSGISNLMAGNFPELVDRSNFFFLNFELDLNVASITCSVSRALRSTDNLKGVSHVRSDQEFCWYDFQKRENFNAQHLRCHYGSDFIKMLRLGFLVCSRQLPSECGGYNLVYAWLDALCFKYSI